VFVTPGATSKSFAMDGCTRDGSLNTGIINTNSTYQPIPTSSLYTATLVIASSGDVSMKAATTETGTVSTLWNVGFAKLQNTAWSVSGTSETPSYTLSGDSNERGENRNYAVYSEAGNAYVYLNSFSRERDTSTNRYTDTYVNIRCNLIDPLALQVNVDAARAAKNLGSAAGVDTFDNYDVPGRIEGGKAFWSDLSAMPQFSNLRFDLATGQLASSPSSTGTYSP
jgi:hypothetical protein